MRVLFVTTEMDDFVRVGGLAAVSAALAPGAAALEPTSGSCCPAIATSSNNSRIFKSLADARRWRRCRPARSDWRRPGTACRSTSCLCPQLYDRPGNPYGDASGRDWPDNDIRFARFASAAAELAAGSLDKNWAADLVHANDWQAALVPAYLAWNGIRIPSILTIHNLAYQGLFPKESLRRIGAPEDSFHIDGLEFYDKLSFLKGGLIYASHLTTVSETYAREITTPEFGCGLEGLLRRRSDAAQLTGILNGIDESWDPRFCAQLAQPFARRRLGRQAGQLRLCPPAIRPGAVARTDLRPRRPPRSPERRRPRAVRRRRDHRRRRADHRHRQRRARHRAGAGRRAPPPAGRDRRSPSASTTARRGGFSPAAISP